MIKQTTQQQIEQTEKKLAELKAKLQQELDKVKWLYIPELKIEIQKSIHHKGKSYNEFQFIFGKEYLEEHLPTYAQLQFLRNSNKYKEVLGLINTLEFVKQEDEISKKKGYVAGFVASPDGAWFSCFRLPDLSDPSLGCRFTRRIK